VTAPPANAVPPLVQNVLDRLENVVARPTGRAWRSSCPVEHSGEHANEQLQITLARDGRVLLECPAGCKVHDVLKSIGLKTPDLFPAQLEEASSDSDEPPASERRYTLYSVTDLDDLPRQEWLVENVLPAKALVGLIGPKGTYKTFAALDMAMHVAFGLEWHGRLTRMSAVAYIFSEGAFGARERVNAWLSFYEKQGLSVSREHVPIMFLPARVPLNSPLQVSLFERDIREQFPANAVPELIIVDTLNRNLDGDEDGKGMTGYVAGCARLQEAFGATVLSVHHTPLGSEDRGRGHSAFDGAIDTRFIISRDDERVTLECTHQRNGPDDWTVNYEAHPFAGSLVLKPSTPSSGELRGQRRQLLELVTEQGSATYTTLLRESGFSTKGFKNALKWLKERAYIKVSAKKYAVTDAGHMALGVVGVPKGSNG
jgi:hypothetical protein